MRVHRDPGNLLFQPGLASPSPTLWLIYETTGDSKLTSCHFSADPSPFPAALSHPQPSRLVTGSVFVLLVKNHPSCPDRSRFPRWHCCAEQPSAILASSCCAGHWKDSSVLPGCKYRAGRDAGDKQSLADVFSTSEPLHLAVACTQMIYGVAGLQ